MINPKQLEKFQGETEQDKDGIIMNEDRTAGLITDERSQWANMLVSGTEPIEGYEHVPLGLLFAYMRTTDKIPCNYVTIGNTVYDIKLIIQALRLVGNKHVTILQRKIHDYPLTLVGPEGKISIAPVICSDTSVVFPTLKEILEPIQKYPLVLVS